MYSPIVEHVIEAWNAGEYGLVVSIMTCINGLLGGQEQYERIVARRQMMGVCVFVSVCVCVCVCVYVLHVTSNI